MTDIAMLVTFPALMGIPRELLDAARLDGASELRILRTIVAPLAAPALITVALLTFIDKWNDFYGPLLYLQKPELRPLSLSIQVFQSAHRTDWPQTMAASILVAAPLVLIYFFAQRKFIEGITLTGMRWRGRPTGAASSSPSRCRRTRSPTSSFRALDGRSPSTAVPPDRVPAVSFASPRPARSDASG